jgi:hypothetical protein
VRVKAGDPMGRFENRGVVNRGVMHGAVVHRAVEKRCGVRCFVNGIAFDADLGQVTAPPSGHDAWVVGDEPVIVVDCSSASTCVVGDSLTPHRGR